MMRRVVQLILLLMLPCVIGAQTRPRTQDPQQLVFGPFKHVYPYDNPNGFITLPNLDSLQPVNLITKTETFGSTSDFTATGSGQTFTVASNVGSFSASGVSSVQYVNNGTTIKGPMYAVSATINQDITGTNYTVGIGYCNSGATVRLDGQVSVVSGVATPQVEAYVSSTSHILGAGITFSVPSTWSLMGKISQGGNATAATTVLTLWVNFGNGWMQLSTGDVTSYYNASTDGNLTGFGACLYISTAGATTQSLQVSNMVTSGSGWQSTNDNALALTPDGRPFTNGTKVYFTSNNSVYTYDTATNKVTPVSTFMWDNGTELLVLTSNLIYDASTQDYRLSGDTYEGGSSGTYYYATIPKSAVDFFTPGVYVIPSGYLTSMTLNPANNSFDSSLVCASNAGKNAWNPSANSCSNWLFAFTRSGLSQLAIEQNSTTADPGTNPTWSLNWTGGTPTFWSTGGPGTTIYRTRNPNGSSGVSYFEAAGWGLSQYNSSSVIYDASGNYRGTMAFQPSSTYGNPWVINYPMLFEFGDNAYMMLADANGFQTANAGGSATVGLGGQYQIAAAPLGVVAPYAQQVGYVADTGTSSSTTFSTGSITLTYSGCYAVFAQTNTNGNTITMSSPSASWSYASIPAVTGQGTQMFALATLSAGATTFTGTVGTADTHQSMVVMRLGGTSCTLDSGSVSSGTVSGGQPSMSATTTQADLGVLCYHVGTAGALYGGTIGDLPTSFLGIAGAYGVSSPSFNTACLAEPVPGAYSGITASAGTGSSSSGAQVFVGIGSSQNVSLARTPTFSLVEGKTYLSGTSVTISDATSGATICYRTDGGIPSAYNGTCGANSSTYSGAITLSASETINAIAAKSGMMNSMMAGKSYSVVTSPVIIGDAEYNPGSGSTTSNSITYTPRQPGSMVFAGCTTDNSTGSLTLTTSPSYTTTIDQSVSSSATVWIGHFTPTSFQPVTITCGWGSASTFPQIDVIELGGTSSSSTASGGTSGSGTSTSFTSGTFSTSGRSFCLSNWRIPGGTAFQLGNIAGQFAQARPENGVSGYSGDYALLTSSVSSQTYSVSWTTSSTYSEAIECYSY